MSNKETMGFLKRALKWIGKHHFLSTAIVIGVVLALALIFIFKSLVLKIVCYGIILTAVITIILCILKSKE